MIKNLREIIRESYNPNFSVPLYLPAVESSTIIEAFIQEDSALWHRMADDIKPIKLVRSLSKEEAERIGRELDRQEFEERSTFTCPICIEKCFINSGSYSFDCGHQVCSDCTSSYVTSKINDGEVSENRLICPCENCDMSISIDTIKGI